jgi:hydroxymethylpyrimidine pyrophosphatase-like HAD family hydrolase
MRFQALATDYDGTIAMHSCVTDQTIASLRKLKASGRHLLLVTGRELNDLFGVFPHPELFDRIVAENGAVLCDPATRQERALATPPPKRFADLLRKRGVTPLSVGRVIVATTELYETPVREAIAQLGLDLTMTMNKGAVMVLPTGVHKATGLKVALTELQLDPRHVVAVGDAENDETFLKFCGFGVAVFNALPQLKTIANLVTNQSHGDGVSELIDQIVANDLQEPIAHGASALGSSVPGW